MDKKQHFGYQFGHRLGWHLGGILGHALAWMIIAVVDLCDYLGLRVHLRMLRWLERKLYPKHELPS